MASALALALLLAVAEAAPAATERDLTFIREGFYRAVEDPAATQSLAVYIEGTYGESAASFPPVIRAYYASLEGLRGKHAKDLLSKLGHVKRAIDLFRDLVETNPGSLEIRFLRFAFFSQLPFLFGVHSYVSTDRAILVEQLASRRFDAVPPDIQRAMTVYLLANAELDPAARGRLQRLQ